MKVPEPRKLPSGAWFIQLRLNGVSVPVTAPSAKECKRSAELIKAEHRAGKRVFSVAPSDLTMRKAIDAYIQHREKKLSPSTIRGYRIIQKCRFQEYMDTPIKNIKSWQSVYDSEIDRLNAKTLKTSFSFLRTVYKFVMKRPAPIVDMIEPISNERPFLSAEEIPLFLDAVRGDHAEIGALLAMMSMRCSELLDLEWEKNINLEKGLITIRGATVPDEDGKLVHKDANKNKASRRTIPIFIPQLREALEAVEAKQGKVIDYTPNGLYKAINRVCEKAGVPKVGIHGMRHSFASLCVHFQIPEKTAMAIGGWSDYKTMRKIYTHISEQDMTDSVETLQSFFKTANENANSSQESLKLKAV